jgi:cytidylate kinase
VIPVIAIDGPTASGKGTIARRVALALGWQVLDSGALYRILALAGLRAGIADEAGLAALAGGLDIRFGGAGPDDERVFLDGREVTLDLRREETGVAASRIAALPGVRAALLARQRAFRVEPGLVADGRDMGTVVFPDAPLKVYLDASVEERARRRHNQLIEKGIPANLAALSREIAERDERDRTRPVAPLQPASDAVVVNTDGVGIEAVVDRVLALARDRVAGIH